MSSSLCPTVKGISSFATLSPTTSASFNIVSPLILSKPGLYLGNANFAISRPFRVPVLTPLPSKENVGGNNISVAVETAPTVPACDKYSDIVLS